MKQFVAHLVSTYGYAGIFGVLMLGIVGIPLPDEMFLTFTGYMISKGKLSLIPAGLAAYSGSICGISLSYFLGRSLGFYLLHRYGYLIHLSDEKLQKTHAWFQQYGKWTLPAGYFIPGVRHVTAYLAGAARLDYRVFAVFGYLGGIAWCSIFIALGFYLGKDWARVTKEIHRHLVTTGIIIATIIVLYALVRRAMGKSSRR